MNRLAILLTLAVLLAACGGSPKGSVERRSTTSTKTTPEDPSTTGTTPTDGGGTFTLTSPDFSAGKIPKKYTRYGEDVSPALQWSGAPQGTKSFALSCDDPTAGDPPFTHWLVWEVPASATSFPPGELPAGARAGKNDFGDDGWGGPEPPPDGPHTYRFKLYALKEPLGLPAGADQKQFADALDGRVLAEAELAATYTKGEE